MQQREVVERKLSRRTSGSIWSRKSTRRSTHPPIPPSFTTNPPVATLDADLERDDEQREMQSIEEKEKTDSVSSHAPSSIHARTPGNIIPDPLSDLPAWYNPHDQHQGHPPRYAIHNPFGPRWYKNQHLIPPAQRTRPSDVFSPSFPPMATGSEERIPTGSRSPSGSPHATPNSSQNELGKPRSRKTSQAAHDNVDLLDVTDPWGTNWHHESPYDVGLPGGAIDEVRFFFLTILPKVNDCISSILDHAIPPLPLPLLTSLHHPLNPH